MEQLSFNQIQSNWEKILSFIKNEYDILEVSFNLWISPLKPHHMERNEDNQLVLFLLIPGESDTLPDNGFQKFVSKRYSRFIEVSIQELTGIVCSVAFTKEKKGRKKS